LRYLAVKSAVKALGAMPLDSSSTLRGMWVGEISGTLSIVKMAERRGSPSTPAPLQYLSQKAPLEAYEEGGKPRPASTSESEVSLKEMA
jgi:hypothetical protein